MDLIYYVPARTALVLGNDQLPRPQMILVFEIRVLGNSLIHSKRFDKIL